MIITMDMLENMLAEAGSTLDTLVHLSPEAPGAGAASAPVPATPTPCRSNISTPSPPPCDDYDVPAKRSSAVGDESLPDDVLGSLPAAEADAAVKTSSSPLFSMASSDLQLEAAEMLSDVVERGKVDVAYQGPYSKTCSNLRHTKLQQKISVSKFVCNVAKYFFII
jgi:hypothetical protein